MIRLTKIKIPLGKIFAANTRVEGLRDGCIDITKDRQDNENRQNSTYQSHSKLTGEYAGEQKEQSWVDTYVVFGYRLFLV